MDGWFLKFAKLKAVFSLTNEKKMSWMLRAAVSLEMVLMGTQGNVKMDGFESFSNIIYIV